MSSPDTSATQATCGFVYVFTNPAMPEYVKIGRTELLPEDRADKLFTTALPLKYSVAHRVITSRPAAVEGEVHRALKEYRTSPRREHFTCSPRKALDAIEDAARRVAGIDSLPNPEVSNLTNGSRRAIALSRNDLIAILTVANPLKSAKWSVVDLWQAHSNRDWLELHGVGSGEMVTAPDIPTSFATLDPVPYANRDETVSNGHLIGKEYLAPGNRLAMLSRNSDGTLIARCIEAQCYVQMIGRTHSPTLLINEFDTTPSNAEAVEIRQWLQMDLPRDWAPRQSFPGFSVPEYGTQMPEPPYWMPQLKPRRR